MIKYQNGLPICYKGLSFLNLGKFTTLIVNTCKLYSQTANIILYMKLWWKIVTSAVLNVGPWFKNILGDPKGDPEDQIEIVARTMGFARLWEKEQKGEQKVPTQKRHRGDEYRTQERGGLPAPVCTHFTSMYSTY